MVHNRLWVMLALCAQILYLLWRWHRFLTLTSTYYVSVPFIACETMVIVTGSSVTFFMIWNQLERPQLRLRDLEGLDMEDYPTVDVMIPCYNEPLQVC